MTQRDIGLRPVVSFCDNTHRDGADAMLDFNWR
jgi:hypothetical protein